MCRSLDQRWQSCCIVSLPSQQLQSLASDGKPNTFPSLPIKDQISWSNFISFTWNNSHPGTALSTKSSSQTYLLVTALHYSLSMKPSSEEIPGLRPPASLKKHASSRHLLLYRNIVSQATRIIVAFPCWYRDLTAQDWPILGQRLQDQQEKMATDSKVEVYNPNVNFDSNFALKSFYLRHF